MFHLIVDANETDCFWFLNLVVPGNCAFHCMTVVALLWKMLQLCIGFSVICCSRKKIITSLSLPKLKCQNPAHPIRNYLVAYCPLKIYLRINFKKKDKIMFFIQIHLSLSVSTAMILNTQVNIQVFYNRCYLNNVHRVKSAYEPSGSPGRSLSWFL